MTARDPNDYFPQDDLDAPRTDAPRAGKAGYVAPEVMFSEGCPKCRGTGKFVSYSGRTVGQCFACKGAGKRVFKTSSDDRAKARVRSAENKANTLAANVEAFVRDHAAVHAWLIANPSEFSTSLLGGVAQYGSLTERQLAAVERNIARDADRAAARADREAAAPVVETAGVDRLKAAFDAAAAYTASKAKGLTVRSPKITVGGITISPAKATSANPGALYVKAGDTYLGKVKDGKFMSSRDCTIEQQAQVLAFVANPADAAKVYGQETGVCCICNATLRSEWRLRGVGPICATKFGW